MNKAMWSPDLFRASVDQSSGLISLHFEKALRGDLHVRVISLDGKVLKTEKRSVQTGPQDAFTLSAGDLVAGTYLIHVMNGVKSGSQKIVLL